MPDPKTCALKFKPGTQEYKDCIAYKGANANKAKASPVKGKVRGGY